MPSRSTWPIWAGVISVVRRVRASISVSSRLASSSCAMVASSRRLVWASCSACSRSWSLSTSDRPRSKLLLPLDGGDVGIDRHPAAPGQGRALDRDRAPVGAAAFHVVGHEGARGLHPVAHEGRGIVDIAVFAGIDEVADRLLEARAGGDEVLGQSEHRLERPVADGKPKVPVIDRQGLLDQVQSRACQMIGVGAARHSLLPQISPFPK
jgi:hypothetical protein